MTRAHFQHSSLSHIVRIKECRGDEKKSHEKNKIKKYTSYKNKNKIRRGWCERGEDIHYFSHEKREMTLNERYDINDRVTYFVLLVLCVSLLLRCDIAKRRHHNENFKYCLTLSPICAYAHMYTWIRYYSPVYCTHIYCSCSEEYLYWRRYFEFRFMIHDSFGICSNES